MFKYSVFTVVLPEYSVPEAAAKMKEWGYDGAEWRVTGVPSPMPSIPNYWSANKATVDFAKLPGSAREAKKISDEAGLEIPTLATYLGCTDLDSVKKAMEAAQIMGAPMLRVGVPGYDGKTNYRVLFARAQDDYAKVEHLAKDHGLKACLEIHMGNICPSASAAYRFVSVFDPKHVGVIFDPGNMVYEGMENWQFGMELLGEYLAHVHVKNSGWRIASGQPNGNLVWQPSMASLRSGIVNWCDVIRALKAVKYNGWLSNENFASDLPTDAKLADDLRYLKSLEKEQARKR
ncbi:MAG TPA: sugar phosphate isomerase/epimerase family protein [Planctomycetota bacterium]|nr:sugar phosphate isomerase/epimerase family protein [Planctomycetota bacterium]